jgi:nitronate monooxygenase
VQKQMVVSSSSEDIFASDAFTGVNANWLRPSVVAAGHDPQALPRGQVDFSRQDQKRWRDLWSAGQGVGSVDRICPVAEVVEQLLTEYRAAAGSAAAPQ